MIVTLQQSERLKNEALKQFCPDLWLLLNYPYDRILHPRQWPSRGQQRRALAELRKLLPHLVPAARDLDKYEAP